MGSARGVEGRSKGRETAAPSALGPVPQLPSTGPQIARCQGHMPIAFLLPPSHPLGSAPTLPPHSKNPGAAHGLELVRSYLRKSSMVFSQSLSKPLRDCVSVSLLLALQGCA